ncbi:MAG: aldo/keto reductase [Kofleriaceae bacterium]|nr:aldo/keto reductase [Kofleriaceae bacterium]
MRTVTLPSGERVPALGQGTWHMGEDPALRQDEVAALRTGLDLGMTLIDTAEMYIGAEDLIREAIAGRREECFIVDKVLPAHATRAGTIRACENSLRQLVTDRIDLYLLHWRGQVPLDETVEAFERLVDDGKIRYWGVSNFDVKDMNDLFEIIEIDPQTNQVLYNLTHRGIEWDLMKWCHKHDMPTMAYSPIDEGTLIGNRALDRVAERHRASPAQVALAWVLRHPDVIAIPKAGKSEHVRDNRGALDIQLTPRDLRDLDNVFDAPTAKIPLEVT